MPRRFPVFIPSECRARLAGSAVAPLVGGLALSEPGSASAEEHIPELRAVAALAPLPDAAPAPARPTAPRVVLAIGTAGPGRLAAPVAADDIAMPVPMQEMARPVAVAAPPPSGPSARNSPVPRRCNGGAGLACPDP